MLRQSWKPITAAALVIGGPGYLYYRYRTTPETFEIPVKTRNAEGKTEMSSRSFALLPLKVLEERINQNATSSTHARPGGVVWKHTTASLASNDPIEDANANTIVQRDETDPAAPGDLLFFAVMDGHSGSETSQLLSKVIIKAVASKLFALNNPSASAPPTKAYWDGLRTMFSSVVPASSSSSTSSSIAKDSNPALVSAAIEEAFVELDSELINSPIRLLAANVPDHDLKNQIPDLSKHPLAGKLLHPAISGSCALMAVFDTAHRNLYVAVTGDSRAVAGVWEPSADGQGQGSWKVEALTEDQTGRNPSELARMQSEHPREEANDVIRNGRVLGGLEPTRAFGDARYKWPRAVQELLSQAFLAGNGTSIRPPPTLFKTPPYVTSRPVVTHRKLPLDSTPSEKPKYFLVMATDGLWDELSNDDVVSLVGGYLAGLKGSIPRSELPSLVPISSGSSGVEGKKYKKDNKTEGYWAFKDDNVSAHLIRNAFGGGDELALRQRLSIPAPYSRRYRDDVTVTVVWWEAGQEQSPHVVTEQLKAKL